MKKKFVTLKRLQKILHDYLIDTIYLKMEYLGRIGGSCFRKTNKLFDDIGFKDIDKWFDIYYIPTGNSEMFWVFWKR